MQVFIGINEASTYTLIVVTISFSPARINCSIAKQCWQSMGDEEDHSLIKAFDSAKTTKQLAEKKPKNWGINSFATTEAVQNIVLAWTSSQALNLIRSYRYITLEARVEEC